MNKRYDLQDIGNFIIHLYDKVGGRYFCNHLKLNKLILISLYNHYLKTGKIFIKDVVVFCNSIYGLKIDTIDTFYRSPITLSNTTCNDSIKEVSKETLEKYNKSKIFGFDEKEILSDEEVKDTLIDTFINYASYDTIKLNNILNTCINNRFLEKISKTNEYARFLIKQYEEYLLIRQIESQASYLASLFYKSGRIYSSNRRKINNLLTINLLCNTNNPKLLRALLIGDDAIGILPAYYIGVIMRDIYLKTEYIDDNKKYTDDFDESVEVPKIYLQTMELCPLDDETKYRLEDIFRNFASFKSYEITEMLKDIIPLIRKDNYNHNNRYKNNKVFNYISSYKENSNTKKLVKTRKI